jgi:hypothetical protein
MATESKKVWTDTDHEKKMNELLKGKTVAFVRYMTEKEKDMMMWDSRPIVIQFTDGTLIIPMMDDEGNDGGAMHYQKGKVQDVLYVLR